MHSRRFAQINSMGITSSINNNERAEGGKPPKKPTKSPGPNKNSRGSKSPAPKKNAAKSPSADSNASKSLATNSTAANGQVEKDAEAARDAAMERQNKAIDEREKKEGGTEQNDEPPPLGGKPTPSNQNLDTNVDTKVDLSSVVTEGRNGKKKAEAKEGSKLNPKNWLWWYWLIIGILVLAVVVAVVVYVFVIKSSDSTSESKVQATTIAPSRPPSLPICTTPACNAYATALTANVFNHTQPCDDFHEYACERHEYWKDRVLFIGADQVKALMADTKATRTGLPKTAKMLRNACESGSVIQKKIDNLQVPNYAGNESPDDYANKLASAGFTNFGHFKLDMSRFMDPNEINPKAVIVIQDRTKFDSSKDFGFKDIDKDYNQFKTFDDSKNVETPTDNELVSLDGIIGMIDVKEKLLINVLKGWFPDGTSPDFMMANVYTYNYPSWTTKIDPSVKIDDANTKKKMNEFLKYFAKKELEKAYKIVVYGEKDCNTLVAKMLPQAFVKFDNNKIDIKKEVKVKLMVEEYITKQVEMLENSHFDDLIDKVNNIKIVVGWPKQYSTNMAARSSVQIDASKMNDIYTAYPEIKKFQVRQHFAHLAKPKEYPPAFFNTLPPSTIYNKDTYTLYITPRLLDDKLLDEGYPSYVKHGGVGVVIGKAVADVVVNHAPNTVKYQNLAQCFEKEGKARPNGKSKQDELVADHMGATSSYQMAKKDGAALLLPGFESSTNDQMFFLSMAQTMCVTPFDGFTIRNDYFGLKDAAKERINGLVSNMPGFATAFQCPAGAQMHKPKKCKMY